MLTVENTKTGELLDSAYALVVKLLKRLAAKHITIKTVSPGSCATLGTSTGSLDENL